MFDPDFDQAVRPLFVPGMGTEHVAPWLYSLVRLTRPRRVLEVGLGYTTPFLARALADTMAEVAADRATLAEPEPDDQRANLLSADWYAGRYRPRLHAIDDFSGTGSSARLALDTLAKLGLADLVKTHEGDFRGMSQHISRADLPFDLVWLDAGAMADYVDFLAEYWPLISQDHGLLVVHYSYWTLGTDARGETVKGLISGPVLNEIKRQQAVAGLGARFEVLSLVEPHKTRQGSVSLIRKLPPLSLTRDFGFAQEAREITGETTAPFPKL